MRHRRLLSLVLILAACSGDPSYDPSLGDTEDTAGYFPEEGKEDAYGDWSVRGLRGWDDEEEARFSAWIAQLGAARDARKCIRLSSCLQSREANSLFTAEDRALSVFADCADLPYVLRAYYSYKRRLPFAFVSSISGGRYTSNNLPLASKDWRAYSSIRRLLSGVAGLVHSGFFRIAPGVESGDNYPVAITRESVRPGTIYYDPNGHVLLVWKVEENGTVRMMDGHPDNSLTVKRFGESFARGSAGQGGGFRNFRRLAMQGQRVVRVPNAAHPDFSTEQYEVRSSEYVDFVRDRLSSTGRRDAVGDYREMVQSLCVDIADRKDAVNEALAARIQGRAHPDALPDNIYGTTGDWETYSTPSRDARLKAAFRELHAHVGRTFDAVAGGDESVFDFAGTAPELLAEYRRIWDEAAASASCRIEYRSSAGAAIALDLSDVMDRLYDLSFDPYHCPELRWGAHPDRLAGELASCPDGANKLTWYRNEARLRNRIDRDYDSVTTLDFGPEVPEDVHVPRLLETLAQP